MKTAIRDNIIQCAIFLALVSNLSLVLTDTFECSENVTSLTTDEGVLSVKRTFASCGFSVRGDTKLIVVSTDSLDIRPGDSLSLEPYETDQATRVINTSQEEGFIISGLSKLKMTFRFDKKNLDNSSMLLKFTQNPSQPVTIEADRKKELILQSYGVTQKLDFSVKKSTNDPVYLEMVGASDFGHRLIEKPEEAVEIPAAVTAKDNILTWRLSPALQNCSGNHESKSEDSVEVIRSSSSLGSIEKYKCVHIFKTLMDGPAHFDVDFKDFTQMIDDTDELTLSDGSQILKITDSNSRSFKQLIPNVSFKGKNLVVLYDSPQKLNRRSSDFKLRVNTRAQGGVVDAFNYKFQVSSGQKVVYSFKQPKTNNTDGASIAFKGFAGPSVKIFNSQNKFIQLDKLFPPIIPLNKFDYMTSAEFSVDPKTAVMGTATYQPVSDCSGSLFEPSSTISIKGGKKTCYWFLGAKSNVLDVSFVDLRGKGSLEIYSVQKQAVIFSRQALAPTEVIPPIRIDGQALVTVVLDGPSSAMEASVSPVAQSFAVSAQQTTIASAGYPNYFWSDTSEKNSLTFNMKEGILSVADLDLRDGEKFRIDGTNVQTSNVPSDFLIKNQTVDVSIERTVSKDFKPHRGYKLVASEYQQIITADMKKTVLSTPKNRTSLLIRIPGAAEERLSYKITFSNRDTNYKMEAYDARSVLGRPVDAAKCFNGSTTSDTLLVSLRSTKDKTFLPELTINYNQVPCNRTRDHVCDGSTRCVPAEKMCKGKSYCADRSDLAVPCSSGPAPPPKVIENGVGGVTVFILAILMFTFGALTALYGPDLYKNFETRYRSGQYTTFQSAE